MTIPLITPLPTAPARSMTPSEFITAADAWVAAEAALCTELNNTIAALNILAELNSFSTCLSTITAAGSSTVDLESTFDETYDKYMIVISGLTPASTATLNARMKIGGTYLSTSTYRYTNTTNKSLGGLAEAANSDSATGIIITPSLSNGGICDLVMHLSKPTPADKVKTMHWDGAATSGTLSEFSGAGMNTGVNALTGIRFYMSTGNITTGAFRLYGIKNN